MRMFCHGYQSWSESCWRTVGADEDPSRTPGAIPLVVHMHSGEHSIAAPGELRSELVTVIQEEPDAPERTFGGAGTIRLVDGELLGVDAEYESLQDWATRTGRASSARVDARFQTGWCSWYRYFDRVTERDVRANLTAAAQWPLDVFQIDDGYQTAVGDWLGTNEKFPSSLRRLAADISGEGLQPGLWLAPFLAAPGSEVARAHPDWFATHRSGRRLIGMVNDHWGGPVHVLDTTQPAVLEHIEAVTAALVDAGFGYLKLDFTYAPGLPGRYLDDTQSPSERVRAAFAAVRRGAGESTFLLGCGAPLGPVIGIVDGMRIGPDVAPWWEPRDGLPGYEASAPSTANALNATRARQFMHRRLWLNDPDCVMLRSTGTELTRQQARRWALAVGDSGGMVLVSDDLSALGAEERDLLDEVLEQGRRADQVGVTTARPRSEPDSSAS